MSFIVVCLEDPLIAFGDAIACPGVKFFFLFALFWGVFCNMAARMCFLWCHYVSAIGPRQVSALLLNLKHFSSFATINVSAFLQLCWSKEKTSVSLTTCAHSSVYSCFLTCLIPFKRPKVFITSIVTVNLNNNHTSPYL